MLLRYHILGEKIFILETYSDWHNSDNINALGKHLNISNNLHVPHVEKADHLELISEVTKLFLLEAKYCINNFNLPISSMLLKNKRTAFVP